jgi:protein-disulfide isomerase
MIRSKYVESGVVLLAFRNYPLSIHTLARKAAEAAVCAGEQRAFWPAHDLLFASQDQLEAAVGRIPMEANLDKSSFEECVRERGATRVQADLDSGSALKVRSTPVFFVGVRESGDVVRVVKVVKGAKPLSEFQTAIEAALQAVPGHRPFSD